ncbi:hypothetical protein CMV_030747 [Castanea mollissima]|uniref:Uncharacterized protein n=1 Tax=Castanea mollissima TaxID=60419 RepID=A0A8J4UXQ7_9ROSI|nr:hypothetical protein CMV_030747 [Castanea mollissima]
MTTLQNLQRFSQWGIARPQPFTIEIETFPEGGKRNAFLRRTSTSFNTLSIKEFQMRSLDKRPRLEQLPEDGISCFQSKLQFCKFLALTKQYQKKKE